MVALQLTYWRLVFFCSPMTIFNLRDPSAVDPQTAHSRLHAAAESTPGGEGPESLSSHLRNETPIPCLTRSLKRC